MADHFSKFNFSLVTGPNCFSRVDQAVLTAVLAIIGRFCVNITFNIGLQYGAELIPTSVRAQGIVSIAVHFLFFLFCFFGRP